MPRPRLTTTLRAAAAAAGLLLAGLTPAAASAAASAPPVPKLTWTKPCTPGFQCDTARVPLDYRDPHGRSVELALIRRPADDRAHRIGDWAASAPRTTGPACSPTCPPLTSPATWTCCARRSATAG
ncbi:hypothetical protein [Kitasatospora sp. NPDC017646]|uniref:hypothetical protein n=1 Tax=Kitasatospora sp. NPDC017646 TaxID=3364024 RepID=UPI003789C8E6